MAPASKRSSDGQIRTKNEIKFEFSQNIFVVVSTFQNRLYVHIRRFEDRYPTKEGVAMTSEEWEKVSEQLCEESDRKIVATTGKIMVKRNKNRSATLTSINKGTSISLTTVIVNDIKERYVRVDYTI